MARQDGRVPIHYAPGGVTVCMLGRRKGVTLKVSEDPRETTCGQCQRKPEWKTAWKNAAKVAKAPGSPLRYPL